MKNFILSIAFVMVFSSFGNATLINTSNNLVYDTDLNITWYAVANNSGMTWDTAMNWAASQNYGNVSGWQLPSTMQMSHLYFQELGNTIMMFTPINKGPFINIQERYYWSREEGPDGAKELAGDFNFAFGDCDLYPKSALQAALLMHDGNIFEAPEPVTVLLLGLGLMGLVGMRNKFKNYYESLQ